MTIRDTTPSADPAADGHQPATVTFPSAGGPVPGATPGSSTRPSRFADPVLRNSMAIMASTVLTSLLGYVFWLLVARISGADASGSGAALTSGLQATVLLASVGSAAAMLEWLPRAVTPEAWRQRVTAGLVVAVVTAAVGAVLVTGVLGFAVPVLPELGSVAGGALFVAASVFFAAGTVVDYVAVSGGRGGLLLWRNVVLTGLRIPLFLIPTAFLTGPEHILAAWTIAAAVSLLVAWRGFRRPGVGHGFRIDTTGLGSALREMRSSLVGQHLITVTAMLAGYLLPILVVARLSPTDNAYFYITWMLGSVFFIVSPAVSTALFAAGAAEPSAVAALMRRALMISTVLLVPPVLVYLVGGGLLLELFGPGYAQHGRLLLVLLALSAIPDALTNIAAAVLRSTGRLTQALRLNGSMLVLCLVGSWLLMPSGGIVAVGACWLGSQTLGAVWVIARWRRIAATALPPAAAADEVSVAVTVTDR